MENHIFLPRAEIFFLKTNFQNALIQRRFNKKVGPTAMTILPEVPLAILKVTFFMVKVARTPLSSPKLEEGGDYSPPWWDPSGFFSSFLYSVAPKGTAHGW